VSAKHLGRGQHELGGCGRWGIGLASRLRFWAMAASTNSSCATVGRLERSRPSRALSARTTWQTRSLRQPAGNLVDRRYWDHRGPAVRTARSPSWPFGVGHRAAHVGRRQGVLRRINSTRVSTPESNELLTLPPNVTIRSRGHRPIIVGIEERVVFVARLGKRDPVITCVPLVVRVVAVGQIS
jgi:hypothetical protein